MSIKNMLDRIGARRIIFLVLSLAVLIPLLYPLGVPLVIRQNTRDFYQFIDTAEAGDVVCIADDMMIGNWPEIGPAFVALVKTLYNKGVKMVFVSYTRNEGVMLTDRTLQMMHSEYPQITRNVDYVHLGYQAGGQIALNAFATDIHVFKEDHYGTDLDDIPMLQGINDITDFTYFVGFVLVQADAEVYVRQLPTVIDLALVVTGAGSPLVRPYLDSGQIKGMVDSIHGSAEFELLSGHPGFGVSSMDIASTGQFLMIALIIIGNIIPYTRFGEKKNGENQ